MGFWTHKIMFRGANKLTLDVKGRLVMPTRYRERLQERCGGNLVVTVDKDQCLLIYPLPDWEDIERKLNKLPTLNPQVRRLQRLMIGHATDLELDSHGRLLLPANLREFGQLTRDAMLIGQGLRFELWDEARWNERRSIVQDIAGVHTPVLLPQVLAALDIRAGGTYMDATYGRGGHAGAILEKLIANGRLLCIDRDSAAVAAARARFSQDSRVSIFLAPFSALAACADQVAPGLKFDGILFDLGVSSPQIDEAERGFSFMQDGPLDMRMSSGEGLSAADVVNRAPLEELIRIFREYGEERMAPRIARAIVMDREVKPFARTIELAEMIARVARSKERHKHPATRVFQALRIHVNGELQELEQALGAALERLAPHGRLAVISFHSLEDRMVKQFMRRHSLADPMYAGLPNIPQHARPKLALVGKAVEADANESSANPRARSARLRVAVRLDQGIAA
jgi:16S rRNA (cytosine1402-N4)-methyltransferase